MLLEKQKADEFIDKFYGKSELSEELKNSNYFMNPRARTQFLKQVFYIHFNKL